uniref:Ig-like domain-containing protein n=1 Tax=Amphimedon queenslandica TaxID=400682 RepID=A0A1X7VWP5_AMPQE
MSSHSNSSSSASLQTRKKRYNPSIASDLLLSDKTPRPGTPPPELTAVSYSTRRGTSANDKTRRPPSSTSTSDSNTNIISSKKRPSTSKSYHPLEVTAVASAAECVRNPSTRSICSRYSIATNSHLKKDTSRCFSARTQSSVKRKALKMKDINNPVMLPPIASGKSRPITANPKYDEYDKYVLQETLFSKVVYKVKKGDYQELPYELLQGFLYSSEDTNCSVPHREPSFYNYFTSSGFCKVSRPPTLPAIPELEAVNHASPAPLVCIECNELMSDDHTEKSTVQWTNEGRLYFSN